VNDRLTDAELDQIVSLLHDLAEDAPFTRQQVTRAIAELRELRTWLRACAWEAGQQTVTWQPPRPEGLSTTEDKK
jgi:hypothetical protein